MNIDKPSVTHDLPTPHVAGFVSAEPLMLAKVYAQTEAEYYTYARLIAAAPEMLAALKWFVENDDTNEGDDPLPERGGLSWDQINAYYLEGKRKAIAAIAKAEGGEA
jgi:hypothetical protein